ncbi:MAG: DUF6161 domain-containing protein [Mesorhizobium sp.]|nr:DUF6161 domain-containing protein [Mesorhizobium sp.]
MAEDDEIHDAKAWATAPFPGTANQMGGMAAAQQHQIEELKDEIERSQQKFNNLDAEDPNRKDIQRRIRDLEGYLETATREFDALSGRRHPTAAQALERRIEKIERSLHLFDNFEVVTDAMERSLDVLRSSANELRDKIEGVSSSQKNFEAAVSLNEQSIENFKETVREAVRFQYATGLWLGRAKRAMISYWASVAVLVTLLLIIPALAIWQYQTIVRFIEAVGAAVASDLPDNAGQTAILLAAFSRLVMITLPVVFYIWLVRIVVRFNTRSLLMMDDANQRNTMLETYLHLVEQDATVKAERPLILEALFRRTPGHGPDSIEPPNLTDIMSLSTGQRRPE